MTTALKAEITDSRVCFPLTAQGGLVRILVEPLTEITFHNLSEGFLDGGNNPASRRKQFANDLKRLARASRPAKLYLDAEQPNWHGDSYQLAAAIAWLRVQNGMYLEHASKVCASALVGKNAEVNPLDGGEANALREKLELLSDIEPEKRPAVFCCAESQNLSGDEKRLLDHLGADGMEVLFLANLKELPPGLIGGSYPSQAQAPTDAPESAPTTKRRWPWWLLASLALLGLASLAEDWVSGRGFLPWRVASPVTPATLEAPELTATFHPDGAPEGAIRFLRGDERLPAGRLHLGAQIRQPGHYYAFLIQRPKAGEGGLLMELFRRAGMERYRHPGRVEIPPHGLHLDGTPARIELLLIARPQADPELQNLIESLPDGLSRDLGRIEALDRHLLALPDGAWTRFTLRQ